jgi:repressor LexA
MKETTLTNKQERVLSYIRSFMEANQVAPSFRDIGRHLGVSVGAIQYQIQALCKKGFLEKDSMLARALRVAGGSAHEIPVLGRVHAGALHASFENVEGHLPVGAHVSPSSHFALKVRGDSMINAGILEGDHVIVRSQQTADDGDIVVAQVEDESTVKFLRKKTHEVWLEPANPAYQPIQGVPFAIAGVVVEVRRQIKKWRR